MRRVRARDLIIRIMMIETTLQGSSLFWSVAQSVASLLQLFMAGGSVDYMVPLTIHSCLKDTKLIEKKNKITKASKIHCSRFQGKLFWLLLLFYNFFLNISKSVIQFFCFFFSLVLFWESS